MEEGRKERKVGRREAKQVKRESRRGRMVRREKRIGLQTGSELVERAVLGGRIGEE